MRQIANGNGNAHTVSRSASKDCGEDEFKMPFSSGFKMILRPIFQNHAKCYAKFDFKILNGDTFPFPLGGEGTRGRGSGVGKGLPAEGEFNRLSLLPLLALRFIWQTISLTKKRSATERVLCLCSHPLD